MAQCTEYKCGCIVHSLAGVVRFCGGCISKTLSGKPAPRPDGAEQRHSNAMTDSPVRVYEVADILP